MDEAAAPEVGPGRWSQRRFIGRRADLRRILSTLEAIANGRGRFVLLSGEPGIGKSRLAQEALARARARKARVVVGRCFEQYTAVPFFPFTEALTAVLATAPRDLQATAIRQWAELLLVVPALDAASTTADAPDTQLGLFRAVTGFLQSLAESMPIVLLLDDLQWADVTSLGLLLYLGRHLATARVLILGTYGDGEVGPDHPLDETLRELVHDRLVDEIHLEPLAVEQTAEIIRAQLGVPNISDELVALVHERAGGNPFFTEELLKAMVEQGGVADAHGRWEPTRLARVEVPRSVRSVVRHRVNHLPVETQRVLRLASVLGHTFELDVLVTATQQQDAGVLDQLDPALSARLVVETPGGRPGKYAFVHALIQQSLYAELPSSERRQLHRQVGEALEARQVGQPLAAAQLARHFLAAGDATRAVRYATQAGQGAARHYAHAEAARHYQVAVDLLLEQGDEARTANMQARVGGELYFLNQVPEALDSYQAALSTFRRLGDAIGQARVYRGIGLLDTCRYDIVAALSHFEAALRLWPVERQDADLGWLLLDTASIVSNNGDLAHAGSLAERALLLAEQFDDLSLLSRSQALVAITRTRHDPRPRASTVLLDEAERTARLAGDWRALIYARLGRADYRELAGNLPQALIDRRLAVEAAERSADNARLAFSYYAVADTCVWTGDWEAGRVAARKGLDLDPRDLLKGWPGRAFLTWMEGRPEEAFEQMRDFIAEARQRDDFQGVAIGSARLAQFALQLDRPAHAVTPAREALELVQVGGVWRPFPGCAYGPLTESAVRLGAADAEALLSRAEQEIEATEQYQAIPQLLRARGLLLQRQARFDAAVEALTASAAIDRERHEALQIGLTLTALADAARQLGDHRVAADADAELVQLVDRIGPEVRALPWAHRVVLAAGTRAVPPVDDRSATGAFEVLTRREREVAMLVARGLTNRQIADALLIAEGTAGIHVDHILTKLGFRSRAQVAAWAVAHGPLAGSADTHSSAHRLTTPHPRRQTRAKP